MRKWTLIIILVVLIALIAGCKGKGKGSDAIPRVSTPAYRDALILKELERQTKILICIEKKLGNPPVPADKTLKE